jgi:hypothetical protein
MEDNYIAKEFEESDQTILSEYHEKGKIHPDFLPFPTYDLVQLGYPYTDHGGMIVRADGGTDENDILQPGKGMWMKVDDFLEFAEAIKSVFDIKGFIEALNTCFRDNVSLEEITKKFAK